MDELQISGKRYISSRRVAKENGYHTDYIGQLIRGGKLKGQKVGRAWYVEADSFANFLGEEPSVVATEQSSDSGYEVASAQSSDFGYEVAPAQSTDSGYANSSADELAEVASPSLGKPPASVIEPTLISTPTSSQTLRQTFAQEVPVAQHIQHGYIPSAPIAPTASTTKAQLPVQNGLASPAPAGGHVRDEEIRGPFAAAAAPEPVKKSPATLVQSTQTHAASYAPSVEHPISVRRTQSEQNVGLRYVAHEPGLPDISAEISRSKGITRIMPMTAEVKEVDAPAPATAAAVPARPVRVGRALALIGAAAGVIFVFSALVSSGLLQTINIEGGDSASVGYTIRW